MARESRQSEAKLPNVDEFDKDDVRASRGMMLLHTINPPKEEDDKIEVVKDIEQVKKSKTNEWPKQRRTTRK